MRLLHCSDFHGNRRWFDWLAQNAASYDLVCLAGDHLDLLEVRRLDPQIRMIKAVLQGIVTPLAICSGNHDSFSGPPAPPSLHQAAWLRELRRPGVWIDGDVFETGGQRFRCIGWNAPLPPASADEIWLYHAPPARSPAAAGLDDSDAGDELLGERCQAGAGPVMVLSGHQHDPRQWACRVGRTWCLNPGYSHRASVPNHIVIDTLARTAMRRIDDRDHAATHLA